MLTLQSIQPGDCVVVKRIHGEGSLKARIMDMGITKGTKITMKKCAPLGDPIELKVRGYSLSIRKAEAANIEVVPCTTKGGQRCAR